MQASARWALQSAQLNGMNMDMTQLPLADGKSDYNFEEAAGVLGISSLELRTLVIEHLAGGDAPVRNLSRLRFRPADLIMLTMVKTPSPASQLD